jgi:HNH endonuclease
MRSRWGAYEDVLLRQLYPSTKTEHLALLLGRRTGSVYQRAALLGIKKSAEWLGSAEACKLRREPDVGAPGRFKPGATPWNKGLRHPPGWAPGRMRETQFKKGNKPWTWAPLGSRRYSKEGYLQRKISETGYPPRDWVAEHVLLWRKKHGPVPQGHKVVFKDGDKSHIALKNLELISNAEMMRRNSVHNLPPGLQRVIQLAGALKRKVRGLSEKQVERFV